MPHSQILTRVPPPRFVPSRTAVYGALLVLFAIGCREPAANDKAEVVAVAATLTSDAPAVTNAATVTSKATAAAKQTTVWVLLKTQANALAAGKASKDWKGKGQAVYNALTTTASSSQASVKTFPNTRSAAKFKSFWIVNSIKVTADQQTIDEL